MNEITSEYLASQGLSEGFPERFWSKVQKTESCWLWIAAKNRGGYGVVQSGIRGTIIASRASWILNNGPVPSGLFVLHNCPGGDNPACVNPHHLWIGTSSDNTKDAVKKGMIKPHPKFGEDHPLAKLTYDIAEAIRSEYSTGMTTQKELAKRYNVSQKAIWMCVRMVTWVHQ